MAFETDSDLIRGVAAGDGAAWNAFVARYTDRVLAATMGWCEGNCRIPRGDYDCILRTIQAQRPEPAETPDGCREGLLVYRFACEGLHERLKAFDESQPLDAFVADALVELRLAYLEEKQGRIFLPAALEAASPLAQGVYRLSAKVASRDVVAARLGASIEEVQAAEGEVARLMMAAGLVWWGLEPVARSAVETPAWVRRPVLAAGDAPDPATASDPGWKRALSPREWWVGLALGVVATAVCLGVVIPREEYSKSVREPGDVAMANHDRPLEPAIAAQLAHARTALEHGQVDAAVQDLNAVLAVRGDDQEARWLLATTYDRLGDNARAAKHYRLFINVAGKLRDAIDDRSAHAQARLGHFAELP